MNEKKPIYKKWWFWVIVVIIIAAIGGGATSTKKSETADTQTSSQASSQTDNSQAPVVEEQEPATEAPAAPEIIISSAELAAAYENNELKGDQLYKDKLAEITGQVNEVSVTLGSTYAVLSGGDEFALTDVQCYFTDEAEIQKLAEIQKGATITVIGTIEGKSWNVEVKECKIK